MNESRRLSLLVLALAMLAPACSDQVSGDESSTTSAVATSAATGGAVGSTSGSGGSGGGGGSLPVVPYPDPDWSTGNPADYGFDPAALDAAVGVAEDKGSTCFIVIRHGVIVSEHYWQGHDVASVDDSWSIAKSYTSALVGIAIAHGDIQGLDESASDFVPEWQGTDKAAITIRNLLDMTSGLKWDAFQDYVTMATFTSDQSAFAVNLDLADPPGTKWIYHNGGVQIFEPIFRNATGMTMEQYAQAYLWSKIGSHASWKHDDAGQPTAYANVLAPCRDHARLGYLYLHGGKWADEQVIPAQYVAETISPSQTMNRAYGFLFWLNAEMPAEDAMMQPWAGRMVPFAPPDLFAARGFGNQFIDVIPSLDLIVVRFAPDPVMGSFDLAQLMADQHFGEHDAILAPVLDALVTP